MKMLDGKVAIITGGATGLGRAFALGFADEGAKIVISDIADEGLKQTTDAIIAKGGECMWVHADVTKPDELKRMADEAVKRFGKIDILVNNAAFYAGVTRRGFTEVSDREWDLMMAVNVKGPWLCTAAVYPYMKAQGKGKVVNLTSETFFTGSHGFVHYVASKGGVVGLTRALSAELGPDNITVNAVAPGFTDTEGSRTVADVTKYDTSKTPLRRLGVPQDIVGATMFLASDLADFITGQIIIVDGGRAMH